MQRAWAVGPVTLIPRIFADTGVATKIASTSAGHNEDNSLSSVGVGLDTYYRGVTVKLDWSRPLDSKPVSDGRDDGRLYAAVSFNF